MPTCTQNATEEPTSAVCSGRGDSQRAIMPLSGAPAGTCPDWASTAAPVKPP